MARSQLTRLVSLLRVLRVGALVTGLLGSVVGCKETSSRGGLVVVLESDLTSPKDIDRIHFEVLQAGKLIRAQDFELGKGAKLLPLEVEVRSPGDDGPVTLRGTAYHRDIARIERHVITPIPTDYFAVMRMPFHYLCNGSANRDGTSSCPDELTCEHGACSDANLDPSQLTRVERGATGTTGSALRGEGEEAGAGTCFDVLACFANPAWVEFDQRTCSFTVNEEVSPETINVALTLPPATDGVCDAERCWVVLSPGEGGWIYDRGEIRLPERLCVPVPDAAPPSIAVSLACPSKPTAAPPCGDWSSQREPIPALSVGVLPSAAIGNSCGDVGPKSACGRQCGVRSRGCRNGEWEEWGQCADEGVCVPGSSQACGALGTQVCGDRCEWTECAGQICTGPDSEACGNCGTRTRECDNGTWSDWTACGGEGVCTPDQVEACGTGGNHTCTGSCEWGECTNQSCTGATTHACAMCGTQARECNEDTGVWSEFGQCDGQGACEPGTTEACGNGGMRTCRGDCQWGELCSGQICSGTTTEPCGNCGIRTRGCDRNTGLPTEWSACTDQGDCEPGTEVRCGNNGTRTCSNRCEWSACGCPEGQMNCSGTCVAVSSSPTNCGACGRSCGSGESCQDGQCVCNEDWLMCGRACVDPDTDPAHCGDCETACPAGWRCQAGECTCPRGTEDVDGECLPPCARGEERCGRDCVVVATDPAHCGGCDIACGTMEACRDGLCTPVCDRCPRQETCVNFQTDPANCGRCGAACTGGQRCVQGSCSGTICRPPRAMCGDACTDLTTPAHCGACETACATGQECVAGDCICPGALTLCGDACTDLTTPAHCGACGTVCGRRQECVDRTCVDICEAPRTRCGPEGVCSDLTNDESHCGTCGTACAMLQQCVEGTCRDVVIDVCQPPLTQCSPTGLDCRDLTTDELHCGACRRTCATGQDCVESTCTTRVCPEGQMLCDDGVCADLTTDPDHCGTCGTVCDTEVDCIDSVCGGPPAPEPCAVTGFIRCGEVCIDPLTDVSNCGMCANACAMGQSCVAGACVAGPSAS